MAAEVTRARFPPEPTAPRHARHLVQDVLRAQGLDGLATDAGLLVSELATNAVLHTRAEFTVTVLLDDGIVRVEIADPADALPVSPARDADRSDGRGIEIVDGVADRWGVEQLPGGGKVVWFELRD